MQPASPTPMGTPSDNPDGNVNPSLPAAATPQDRRLEQLHADGLLPLYRDATPFKTILFPAAVAAAPRPMLRGFRCAPGFMDKHDRIYGALPASGIFTFRECYISKAGTVLDKARRVCYDDDLISSYWMWFLGKLALKAGNAAPAVPLTAVGRFMQGQDVEVAKLKVGAATLVNLTKPGPNVYGHWILDVLPMVFNLFEAVRAGALEPPFKFLLSERTPNWAKQLLTLVFDISQDDIVCFDDDKVVLKVNRLVVPSLMRVSPLISPRMNAFVEHVTGRMQQAALSPVHELPRRIFISRENFSSDANRVLANADEVEAIIRAEGLQPIRPEELPWLDQVRLFAQAEVVMGEYGSGMHNTLFSPASTISIVMANLKSNWNQSSIAALRGQEIIYIKPSHEQRTNSVHGLSCAYDKSDLAEAIRVAVASKLRRVAEKPESSLSEASVGGSSEPLDPAGDDGGEGSTTAASSSSVHERRIAQLGAEGLGGYYLSAAAFKTEVFPPTVMPPPQPLLHSPGFKQEFNRFHCRLGGILPASGFYRFHDVFVGNSGTVLSADRRIYWSEDLISAYWMLFLSKMIRRDALGQTRYEDFDLPESTAVSRFITGSDGPITDVDDGATLVSLMKPGPVVYGHWILDVLPMVWQLQRCVEQGALRGSFRYLLTRRPESWALRMLDELFDIRAEQLVLFDDQHAVLRVRELIVPSLLRVSPLISPRMNEFVDFVLARVLPRLAGAGDDLPRNFYISRSGYETPRNKKLDNNEALIRALDGVGLPAIQPEKLPWSQQLALFTRARMVVGEFGSGMHNAIFGSSALTPVVLSHRKRNWNQSSIAAIRGQRLAYVAPSSEQWTGLGQGVVYEFDPTTVTALVDELRRSGH